jgi:molybdopterin synthase sulfur carrier subunit
MPRVILTGSVQQRVGGLGAVEVAGDTAGSMIRALEAAHPALRGWIVDEQGSLRRHVKLFHGGVAVSLDKPVGPNEELHIVAAISGG